MSDARGPLKPFALNARPLAKAVLERRREAMPDRRDWPFTLMALGSPLLKLRDITPTCTSFALTYESVEHFMLCTLDWTEPDFDPEFGSYGYVREWPMDWDVSEREKELLNDAVGRIWSNIHDAFLEAARAGREAIYARLGSPLEPEITRIPADVWAYCRVKDWRTGTAIITEGTLQHLYSVHSVALTPGASVAAPSIDEAYRLLEMENETRVTSGLLPMTQEETLVWALPEGFSREVVRSLRARLPARLKLSRGEKRADAKVKIDTA